MAAPSPDGAGSGSAGALWATCAAMFVGALLTGLPPLWWSAGDAMVGKAPRGWLARALQGPAVRMLSAGLMLGSGLGVVLPEGFFAFTEGAHGSEGLPEWTAGGALLLGFVGMLALQTWLEGGAGGAGAGHHHSHLHGHRQEKAALGTAKGDQVGVAHLQAYRPLPSADCATLGVELSRRHADGRQPDGAAAVVEARVGRAHHTHREAVQVVAAAEDGRGQLGRLEKDEEEAEAAHIATGGGSSPGLALGGLLIHSAADGLAVGAASLGGGGSGGAPSALSVSVAAAILMHKLPVTFGLTAYLREAGWRRDAALQGLLAFSASAPLAALATYYLLHGLLGSTTPLQPDADAGAAAALDGAASDGGVASTSSQSVALAVLFSGGTFLAAATQHILPAALEAGAVGGSRGRLAESGGAEVEVEVEEAKGQAAAVSGGGGGSRSGSEGGSVPLVFLAAGAVLPLLIAALLPED